MLYRYLSLVFIVASLSACTDSFEDLTRVDEVRYSSELAVPLVDSEINLTELVGEANENVSISIDPDGLLRFRYSGEVPEVGPDIVFDRLQQITRGIFLPVTRRRQAVPFGESGDIDVDRLLVSGGLLTYALPNPYDVPVRVNIGIPEATRDGVPFSVSGELPAHDGTGTPPILNNLNDPIDLAGYAIEVPEDSLYFEYEIQDLQGNPLDVPFGTSISLQNLEFSFMRGYLGQQLYDGFRDTVEVDFFDRYLEGDIYFVDPTVTVTLTSSFGLPALALVEVLQIEDVNGNIIPIEGTAVDQGFNFNFPTVPGQTASTTFVFDRNNSNIDEVLSARPVALDYLVNALINPDADTSIIGFLTDSSFYKASVDVELPLFGNAGDFTLRDTFDLDITQELDDVRNLTFRLTTYNGLPVDIALRGTFLDSLGNVVADLTNGESLILQSPPVNAQGEPSGRVRSSNDYPFDRREVDAVLDANRLVLEFDISTADGGTPFVRVTDEQTIQVLIGALIDVERN